MTEPREHPKKPSFIERIKVKTAPPILIGAALGELVSDDFDVKGFRAAIRNDDTLKKHEKRNALRHFSLGSGMVVDLRNPGNTLPLHMNRLFGEAQGHSHGKDDEEVQTAPLPDGHPIKKIWEEVWQQVTVHHAAEAAVYEQRMAKKGISTEEHLEGYPVKTPPILLWKDEDSINAAAGPSGEGGVEAVVTKKFLKNFSPEEQRAVLFHEAQHAFEPVLAGKTPNAAWLINSIQSKLTANAAARKWERRADEMAAKAGMGEHSARFMEKVNKLENAEADREYAAEKAVIRHLADHGFALDAEKMGAALVDMHQQLHEAGFAEMKEGRGLPPAHHRPDMNILSARIEEANDTLQEAAYAPEGEPSKFASFLNRVSESVMWKVASHPETESRVEQLRSTEKCDGCDPEHPSKLHGDRVKTISSTGIQGYSR